MFTFLLVLQTLIAATMIGVILMQRSEGGGLGVGGSPAGMLSARGAGDFLTRATAILAMLFVGLAIVLAGLAATRGSTIQIDPTLATSPVAPAPAGGFSMTGDPVPPPAGGTGPVAPAAGTPADPLAAGAAQQGEGQSDTQGIPLNR